MQAIKLVTGVIPTCWRPPYGDIDVRSTFPHSFEYRNINLTFSVGIGRIQYIADQLGLQTVIWGCDSFDWRVGTVVQTVVGNTTTNTSITTATVNAEYDLFISNLTTGTFNTAGGILLTHKLNNFTMQEAINWYSRLKASFNVRCTPWSTSSPKMLTLFLSFH